MSQLGTDKMKVNLKNYQNGTKVKLQKNFSSKETALSKDERKELKNDKKQHS